MKRPIAILFANLKGNLGDFAILQAMLEDLSARFPGHPMHVFTHPFTRTNETDLAVFRASAPAFEVKGPAYSIRFPFYLKWMTRYGVWPRIQARYVRSLAAAARADAARFRDYHAVVMAGGDQWGGSNPGTSMFGTVEAIAAHNDRIYAYPFSIAPAAFRYNSREALGRYFRRMRQPVVVRDVMSRDVLKECGIEAAWGIDCVFSLKGLADEIEPAAERDPSRVLLVITGRHVETDAPLRALIVRLKDAEVPVELMSTSPPDDLPIFGRLGPDLGVPVRMPGSWQEAVAELKASRLIVTNRLHAMIFGCFGESPILPVTDRAKAAAFARDVGLTLQAGGPDDVSPTLVEQAIANRDEIVSRLRTYMARSRRELFHPVFDAARAGQDP